MRESSYPAAPPVTSQEQPIPASRRELRAPAKRTWLRQAIAVGAGLALVGATYGFVSLNTGEVPLASLSAEIDDAEFPRASSISRNTDRLPLDDATQRTIAVTVDGQEHEITTRARTLALALSEAGIEVGYNDIVSAPMNGEPVDATIQRVVESIETVEEKIPFRTTRTESATLVKGQERVQTQGRDGTRTATKRVLRQGDEIVSEEILAEAVGAEAVDEVILVGTAAPAPQAPVSAGPASPAPSTPAPSGGSPRAIAQGMLGSYGWGSDQWSCLDRLWQRESGWRTTARNPYSGAYGIPQSLPASKMASAGSDYLTNPATQIRWGLGYIKGRYGSPCGAWAHSQRTGWY